MTKHTINLESFRAKNAKVFTGRDRGEAVRRDSKIDEIENEFDEVEFVIPDNIYSINPSFFEELFFNVVQKLGREEFLAKFKFDSLGDYDYERPLNEAIDRILRKRTGLDS
jgi:STAS-like domain of unknown function (DUF4325)